MVKSREDDIPLIKMPSDKKLGKSNIRLNKWKGCAVDVMLEKSSILQGKGLSVSHSIYECQESKLH